jgi:hypothetical protein
MTYHKRNDTVGIGSDLVEIGVAFTISILILIAML